MVRDYPRLSSAPQGENGTLGLHDGVSSWSGPKIKGSILGESDIEYFRD